MLINDSVLQNSERINFALRELYAKYGYRIYHMSKFEEYDLYAKNKDFLVSDNVITFTDTNGSLMALKPDVTLSMIKNSKDMPDITQKVFYNENVYRVSKGTDSFKEIMQTGLECFGHISQDEIFEVILLASKSLQLLSSNCVLGISNLNILESLIDSLNIPSDKRSLLYTAIGNKNIHEIYDICSSCQVPDEKSELLKELLSIRGSIGEALPKLKELSALITENSGCADFTEILERLSESEIKDIIRIDFSVTDDINYYNGIVFKGFINGIPTAVISGGQYDKLMKKLKRKSKAIGFAVYMDALDRIELSLGDTCEEAASDEYLNIALPKGRLGESIYDMFAKAGLECPSITEQNRKLVFENPQKKIRYFWVKPSDVAIYVERGAADIGVAGKDIIFEYVPDVYEVLDLKKGVCRMAVAAPKGFTDDHSKTLRVATKFSRIAEKFYKAQGRDIDIIHLNGSIEIAPILGLSDVIVDIVETGVTLKENKLEVIDTIVPISARLIVNKSSFKFKAAQIESVIKKLSDITEE